MIEFVLVNLWWLVFLLFVILAVIISLVISVKADHDMGVEKSRRYRASIRDLEVLWICESVAVGFILGGTLSVLMGGKSSWYLLFVLFGVWVHKETWKLLVKVTNELIRLGMKLGPP